MTRIDLDTKRACNEDLFSQYDVWHNHCKHLGSWERGFGIGCTSGDLDKLNNHWTYRFISGESTRITHLMCLEIKSHGYRAYRNGGQKDMVERTHQAFKLLDEKDPTFCYHGFYFISHEDERPGACLGCPPEVQSECDYNYKEVAGEIYYCAIEDFPNFQLINADSHRQLLKSINHKYPFKVGQL